jgi:hypothetical protein
MQQRLDEGTYPYQGRSWPSFVLLEAKKSAEAIVDELQYELHGMSVEVERTDWPSYPTTEVFIEGLNVVSP